MPSNFCRPRKAATIRRAHFKNATHSWWRSACCGCLFAFCWGVYYCYVNEHAGLFQPERLLCYLCYKWEGVSHISSICPYISSSLPGVQPQNLAITSDRETRVLLCVFGTLLSVRACFNNAHRNPCVPLPLSVGRTSSAFCCWRVVVVVVVVLVVTYLVQRLNHPGVKCFPRVAFMHTARTHQNILMSRHSSVSPHPKTAPLIMNPSLNTPSPFALSLSVHAQSASPPIRADCYYYI